MKEIRAKQRKVQEEMIQAESESLAKWRADKAKSKPDEGTIDSLLQDPAITAIEAPMDANVRQCDASANHGLLLIGGN